VASDCAFGSWAFRSVIRVRAETQKTVFRRMPTETNPVKIKSSSSQDTHHSGLGPRSIAPELLAWYDTNKRDLPWRTDRDPYRVWISEIMLQQTRVAAVIEHYRRFLERFPTVQKLAAARASSVLAAWSGLGYYRRARMLHAAAKKVVKEFGGEFPTTSVQLRSLPGVGRYTAAAIASIAFDEPLAVVDGNVERVIVRVNGKRSSGEELWQSAERWLDRKRPGDFNQAMMELGATICLPRAPQCLLCPIRSFCATRGELKDISAPSRQKKREIHFALARRGADVFLVQRNKQESLMPGMWELPQYSGNGECRELISLRHSITVTDYRVRVVEMTDPGTLAGRWVPSSRLQSLPLTGLARKILKRMELL
jgi:A/G-specific adenine glycosylase